MKQKKIMKALAWLFVFAFVLTALMPMSPLAVTRENVKPDKIGTLSIEYQHGACGFRLYRVADIDEYTKMTWTKEFANYPQELNGMEKDAYTPLAVNLNNWIRSAVADGRTTIQPTKTITTDDSGKATFQGVQTGLYLLVKDRQLVEEEGNRTIVYAETPMLVSLPSQAYNEDGTDWVWSYDPTITVKPTRDDLELITELVVTKRWDFDAVEDEDARKEAADKYTQEVLVNLYVENEDPTKPDEIYVDENGKKYENIVLNEKNNWTEKLNNLNINGNYYFREVLNDNLTANFNITEEPQADGKTTVITNKFVPEEPEEPTTQPPESTTKPTGDTPNNPGGNGGGNKKLPQTGQLWWPVPVLGAAGLLFFTVGMFKNKRYRKANDKKS